MEAQTQPLNRLKIAVWSRDLNNVQQVFDEIENNVENRNDLNIIGHAIKLGDADMVKFFIAKFPNLNQKEEEDNHYPLHAAVIRDNLDIVSLLIDAGADVNAKTTDAFQETPLQIAVKTDAVKIVKLLVERGASVAQKNAFGESAQDLAGSEEMKNLLK
jgi:ankyrin repeat protein